MVTVIPDESRKKDWGKGLVCGNSEEEKTEWERRERGER